MIIYLMVLHFIADFLLQNREMGKRKSQELKWLGIHLAIQLTVFSVGLAPLTSKWFLFALANALAHGLIDWNIWRFYKAKVIRDYRKLVEEAITSQHPVNSIDYNVQVMTTTMKLASKHKYWEDELFYTTIGADQLLHMSTLVFLSALMLGRVI